MVFVLAISSPALADGTPASDLHGERWEFEDSTREKATARAQRRLEATFVLASPERIAATSLRFVGAWPSRQAYARAEESGISLTESDADAVVATLCADDIRAAAYATFNAAVRKAACRHDYTDCEDICSRCDAMRPMRKAASR